MPERPTSEVQHLGHLGIIASIFKEYGIVEQIDSLLPKTSNNQNISHGEAILAMVIQGLGFSNHRLYLSGEFFSHVAMHNLFRKEVDSKHFNGDSFGRTLDAIFEYGATRFFTDVTLKILIKNDLLSKFLNLDSTSLYATGKKYKGVGNIELKRGYSKDYRMDLKQLVLLLVTTDDGLPIFSETHSGNTTDSEIFQKAIVQTQNLLKEAINDKFFVADSALYSKDFLLNKSITGHWITRVPESVGLCKQAVEREYDKILWTKVDKDFKFVELESSYGGKKQKWILVRNRESKYKELETFKKQLTKEEGLIQKKMEKLKKKIFYSKEEAGREVDAQQKYHLNFIFNHKIKELHEKRPGQKRKVRVGYIAKVSFKKNNDRIKKCQMRKGRFILATNCLDDEVLNPQEMLKAYRGRNGGVEGCFKFLKDKTHNLNQIFLKKECRIEAMMMVMSLVLFINNLAQKRLRSYLESENETIPTQLGGETKRPTFKWASYLLRHITKVQMKVSGIVYDETKGLKKAHETIIKAFGDYAIQIYGLDS